ncbi:hypothetical protein N6L27_00500 [Leisingera sp. SS27]|uniref:hypothetical protein n=1 Tax=Leisingera sp. SS27 TaxID=2979462 RepID=UPI00232EB6C4|nr:hypothetical protein [Leisingera sp. SS27]MDC0656473.1 hypothetical protein [Leisingera sp. SS27]
MATPMTGKASSRPENTPPAGYRKAPFLIKRNRVQGCFNPHMACAILQRILQRALHQPGPGSQARERC